MATLSSTSSRLLGRKFFPRRSLQLSRPVVLIGLDSDETRTVAFQLAQSLGLVAVDCDSAIRYATGRTSAQLVDERGEAEYRRLERDMIETVLASPQHCVLSVGDGALIDAELRSKVAAQSHLVALRRNLSDCFEHFKARSEGSDRWHPLFSGALDSQDQLDYFYQARSTSLDAAAESVDLRGMSTQAVAKELAARWSSRSRLAS